MREKHEKLRKKEIQKRLKKMKRDCVKRAQSLSQNRSENASNTSPLGPPKRGRKGKAPSPARPRLQVLTKYSGRG